jgi:hypothetical protein
MMMSGRRGAALDFGKYHQKLQNLSRVLLEIGSSENKLPYFYRLF